MKINLPKNSGKIIDASNARMLYDTATAGTTRSKFASMDKEADIMFTLPKMFDPARRGMTATNRGNLASGYDLLEFDTNEYVRQHILLGLRNIAKTHPIVNACVNIYSRYPVQGIDVHDSDPDLERFYRELFIEELEYRQFFIDMGRVFWVDGSAFSLGNWNDDLGLWVGEDILDPLTVRVERIPLVGEDSIYIVPQDSLKQFVNSQTPEARSFINRFPDMARAIQRGEDIPLSNDRVVMMANKDRPSDLWGTPTLLRAWNTLMLEDRMNGAMRATAERLYAPLIMFTIGGTLPDGTQYIPSAAMLDAFRANLDAALSSDFRAIVTHSGVQSQEIIRADKLNNFKNDWDMYDDKIMMAFGLSPAILKPNSGTYATSALEFQLAAQMMASYQNYLIKIYNKRAAFVAEAQGHYETEKKGSSSEVVMERREVWDAEAGDGEGAYVVKEVPKLKWPKMTFDVINFRDEQKEREFRLQLKKEGVPIADEDIAIGVEIDLADSAAKYQEEQKKKKIDEARREQQIFKASLEQGLVVPPTTKQYMEAGIAPLEWTDIVQKYKNEGTNSVVTDRMLLQQTDMVGEFGQTLDNGSDVRSRPYESDEMREDAADFQ